MLPPEVISRVARHVLGRHDDDARPIFPLTHVCRYWRESIVSTPENWTLISSFYEGVAALSLERAKAAPLELSLNMYGVMQHPRLPEIIMPHFKNVVSFTTYAIPTFGELFHPS